MIDKRLQASIIVTALAFIIPSLMVGRPYIEIRAFVAATFVMIGFGAGYMEGQDDIVGYLWENDLVKEPDSPNN